MKKLLILTPYVPYPVNSGGNQYIFGLIDRMRKYTDISLVLISRLWLQDDIKKLKNKWPDVKFFIYDELDYIENNYAKPKYYHFLQKIKMSIERKLFRQKYKSTPDYMVRRTSALYVDFYKPLDIGYLKFVEDIIKNNLFDLIEVNYFDLITLADILPDNIKKIFVHHELRYIKNNRELIAIKNHSIEDIYLKNYSKNIEIQHLLAYDAVVTMTEHDKLLLEKEFYKQVPVFASPAVVNLPENIQVGELADFNNKIVFLGGTNHYPNKEGFDWFINNCWEKISEKNKNLILHVIGLWDEKTTAGYTSRFDNIVFRGYVDDLSAELRGSIMVIPINIGSGIRIKALDAIVNGVPIVATSVGVEGLGMTDGVDAFIKDDADSFTQSLLALASDKKLYEQFRKNMESLLELWNPQRAENIRKEIYEEILNSKQIENKH